MKFLNYPKDKLNSDWNPEPEYGTFDWKEISPEGIKLLDKMLKPFKLELESLDMKSDSFYLKIIPRKEIKYQKSKKK